MEEEEEEEEEMEMEMEMEMVVEEEEEMEMEMVEEEEEEMEMEMVEEEEEERVGCLVCVFGLVHQIIERYVTPTSGLRGRALSRPNLPDRLGGRDYIARHYLIPIPPPEKQEGETRKKRKRAQRQCIVCAHSEIRDRVRQLVTTMCKECQLPMCMLCFRIYHVQIRY
ncbi:hypothetical protein Pmani_000940 [Petrolisthes manimaculis]|uniref:PiggyBac transposable element-derived protein 4 C-terminal zinc-finger domain-containing protein n=1 Tax=Petrolisthes manimaculis TaxID=1843537 RepID=A0AAE1QLF4_9EUCA|nr:hypothetical protein Pmani_000940 [Petrolisthes manimaculis]